MKQKHRTNSRAPAWLAACAVAATVALPGAIAPTAAHAETLRYATIGEPPSLDVQMGTATLATTIAQNMFETLYAFDSEGVPQPMLVESDSISDDGKTIVLTLRTDVPFHNGETMTAEDVVASLNRWVEHGARGETLNAATIEATGDNEVTLTLSEVNGAWKNLLAFPNGGPVIYPAEIVTEAGGEPIKPDNYVGTGPYQFVEWRPNRHVELTKFEDYASRSEPSDGSAGAKEATIETLQFVPVTDVGTRVSGVQAGDYDYAEYVSGDLYGILKDDPSIKPHISDAPIFGLLFMNSQEGILAGNYQLRQAILAGLNMTEALQISVGDEELFSAQGSFFPEGNVWYTEAGTENYNQGDAEKAKSLAEEAGYDGEPISLLVSTNYQQHFDQANVFKQQLAEAGIEVELNVTDWATLLTERSEPQSWDMFMTHHGPSPDPVLLTFMNDTYPGWWTSEEKEEHRAKLVGTSDLDEREAAWATTQELVYEQLPAVKVGDVFSFDIASPQLTTPWERAPAFPYFWGASK